MSLFSRLTLPFTAYLYMLLLLVLLLCRTKRLMRVPSFAAQEQGQHKLVKRNAGMICMCWARCAPSVPSTTREEIRLRTHDHGIMNPILIFLVQFTQEQHWWQHTRICRVAWTRTYVRSSWCDEITNDRSLLYVQLFTGSAAVALDCMLSLPPVISSLTYKLD